MLYAQSLYVSAVNLLLIKKYGNNSLCKIKTDKTDSIKITRYGLNNGIELREYNGMDEVRYNFKTLNRQFQLISKQHQESANNLIALLEQTLPGMGKFLISPPRADGHQKWCKAKKYNFSEEKPVEIYAAVQEMVVLVPMTNLSKLMVQQAAEYLTASVAIYRAEMNRLASQLPEYPVVMGMFGVGSSLGPQLMAEVGDVTRFVGKQSLVAFAGVDPKPNESSDKKPHSSKFSKRGSPYLRKALFNVMDVYIKFSPPGEPIYPFLDKKRQEGKPYYVYMTAGANQFLRHYYAKVRDYLGRLNAEASQNVPDLDGCVLPQS